MINNKGASEVMKFIKPKTTKKKVTWEISDKTLTILNYYSKYSQYSEEEIVDMFLENLLEDEGFIEWINKQRYKKRIEAILQDCELVSQMAVAEPKSQLEEGENE